MVRVCFVCLGNICRSPTAAGVMRHLVQSSGLDGCVEVESAGTAAYHAGERPDVRATEAARRRGIRLEGQARRFGPDDWERFDYILAMDRSNFQELQDTAPSEAEERKLRLLRSFDSSAPRNASVPDPYYGEGEGFEQVLDMCESACRQLLEHIRSEHGL